MDGRSRARYLAPIMLVAAIGGVYLIAHHNATERSSPRGHAHHHKLGPRFYLVKPGESLSTISQKTGVPLATIEQLNPLVDPNTLAAGRRLRLRR
jgi:hypothetical protein